MSDFWSRKLGANPPAPPTPQSVTPAPPRGQGAWWQNPQGVPQQPQAVPQQQVVYDAQGNPFLIQNGQLVAAQPQQQDPLAGRKLPRSASSSERCPECDSGDYAITGKGFNKSSGSFDVWKCFDCGYPVVQEFSGMIATTEAYGGKAQQVAHGGVTNQFSPQSTQAPAFAAEQGGPGR